MPEIEWFEVPEEPLHPHVEAMLNGLSREQIVAAYLHLGEVLEDDERGRSCACRWHDWSLHPQSICGYHLMYAHTDERRVGAAQEREGDHE